MLQIIKASDNFLKKWDDLISQSINGTIFHKRTFLSYHGDKFKDKEKYLVVLDGTNPLAQISLSIDGKVAKSPYGASYGGFVFQKLLSYHEGKEVVECLIRYLKKERIRQFRIIMPPAYCSKYSLDTFYFNLMENGFKSINRDIENVVCFSQEPIEQQAATRGRRMAKKALSKKIQIQTKTNSLKDFYQIMEKTFKKHGQNPTHSKEELNTLIKLLPGKIYFDIAYKDDMPIAGIGFFEVNQRVNSSFYLCQDPAFQNYQGQSLLILEALKRTQKEGFLFFNFGTSSINMVAKENIFTFKENFSKTGFFRETFEWQS